MFVSIARRACLGLVFFAAAGLAAGEGVRLDDDPGLVLRLYSANQARPLTFQLERVDDATRQGRLPGGGVCRVRREVRGDAVEYELSFTATGERPRLYRAELSAERPTPGGAWRYWNGAREADLAPGATQSRERFTDTFPLATLTAGGETGFALGLAPDGEFSSFASRAEAGRGGGASLAVSSKVVVDGRHPQRLVFVAYAFRPRFGWRDAVQAYHDRYPATFRPKEGVDGRLYGNGGYLGLFRNFEGFELHPRRFDRLSWEWSYAPWVMAGNWYPEPDDELEEQYRSNSDRIGELPRGADGNVGWATYNNTWKKHFASADRRIAMMYYLYVNDIHKSLLERFPDARFRNADGGINGGGSSSIASDRGHTGYAFPHGSGLQAYLERKIRLAAENYAISGFAFDMANNFTFDYSPAQLAHGRYRTYDDEGKVCTGNFATPVLFAEFIHGLTRGGRRMGVSMNYGLMGVTAPSAFAADAVLFEGTPADNLELLLTERLLTGQKPLYFWGGVTNHGVYSPLDWPRIKADPALAARADEQLARVELFCALRYGVAMQTWAAMHPVIRPWNDAILALQRLGWNAADGMADSSGHLWIGRFGRDAETVFSVTNPEREPVTARLTLFHDYLGDGAYLPVAEEGALELEVADGQTAFDVTLPAKGILLLPVMKAPAGTEARVRTWRDAQGGVRVQGTGADGLAFPARDYAGRTYGAARVDGDERVFPATPAVYEALAGADAAFSPAAFADAARRPAVRLAERPTTEAAVAADMLDLYTPFRRRNPRPAEKVAFDAADYPGLDARAAMLARLAPDAPAPEDRYLVVVGAAAELPWLDAWLDDDTRARLAAPDQGVLRFFPERRALWIGGNSPLAVERAGDAFFRWLDAMPPAP